MVVLYRLVPYLRIHATASDCSNTITVIDGAILSRFFCDKHGDVWHDRWRVVDLLAARSIFPEHVFYGPCKDGAWLCDCDFCLRRVRVRFGRVALWFGNEHI